MSQQRIAGGIVLVAAVLCAPASFAAGDILLFLGQKQLDEKEFAPVESQLEAGMLLTVGGPTWPVKVAIDLLVSDQDEKVGGVTTQSNTIELDLGVRKFWQVWKERLRPFAGGGLAIIKTQAERNVALVGTDTSDSSPGGWIDGGVLWQIRKRFSLGLEARYSTAGVKYFGNDVDAGGTHAGLVLGWRL